MAALPWSLEQDQLHLVRVTNGTLFTILCTTFDHNPKGPGQKGEQGAIWDSHMVQVCVCRVEDITAIFPLAKKKIHSDTF